MSVPGPPRIAIVVVSWNSASDLATCLGSLAHVTLPVEVVVVDNASTDGSADIARAVRPAVTVIEAGDNLGFARASNRGWRATSASFVLFLNPDAVLEAGAVEALVALLESRPDVGIVGPATFNRDGTPQVSFGPDLTPLAEWRQSGLVRAVRARDPETLRTLGATIAREQEPDWISGSCLLARRSLLERLSGFDERFFLYEEDVDLCARARASGSRVVFTPAARVTHGLGRSMEKASDRARLEYARSHLLYYRKHRGWLATGLLRILLMLTRALGLRGR